MRIDLMEESEERRWLQRDRLCLAMLANTGFMCLGLILFEVSQNSASFSWF